jgi:hypothetical protein
MAQTAVGGSPSTVPNALTQALYLRETGDAAAISVSDINQGQLEDCFLLSSIGEIALFHPSLITQMIHANADGTETVTLYDAADGSLPDWNTTSFAPVPINVTNSFPSDSVNNQPNQDVVAGQKEIWVQVLEKAVALLGGGYNSIANGGSPVTAMEELTGCAATYTWPGALSLQQLQSDASADDLITFDSLGYGNLAYGMHSNHAYMFQSLSTVAGAVMVNLLNPWGFDQPAPIPFSRISSVCDEIDVDPLTQTINPGPTLTAQTASQTWTAGQTVSFALPANTFSAVQGLTYTATLPSGLTINASTGTISGTVPVARGTYAITITAKATGGLSAADTFYATVTASAPTLKNPTQTQTWSANKSVSFVLPSNTFTDPQAETLACTVTGLPTGLSFNTKTLTISGSTVAASASFKIMVTAKDLSGLAASETFQAVVAAQAPTLKIQTATPTWTADKPVSFTLPSNSFVDPQGEKLTFAATLSNGLALPSWLKENATTGALSGTAPITPQTLGIRITATDQSGLSVADTFSAIIQAAAPTVANRTPNLTWTDGSSMCFLLSPGTFADPQGTALTCTAYETGGSNQTGWLQFDSGSNEFTGVVPAGLTGTIGIKVVATDPYGLSCSESFGITFGALGAHMSAAGPTAATELLALHG